MIEGMVSIIIPVYNYGRYAHKAIESALTQTYADVEVIVIDDGSTDDTHDILCSFGGTRYRLLSQDNMGVSIARNRAALVAKGEFLLPLDADDWIEPNYLERTVPHMADPQVGVVATDYVNFGAMGGRITARATTLQQEMNGNSIPITSLIRKTAFEQTPGYTTAFIETAGNKQQLGFEDWNLWIDILKRGWKVYPVNEPLFHYRTKVDADKNWRNSPETLDKRGDVGAWCVSVIRKLHPELRW
jgi:glycosyltransferase involved in cell wall biosynthesis